MMADFSRDDHVAATDAAAARPGRSRLVLEPGTGRTWRVHEQDTGSHSWAAGRLCLIFDAADVVRRVWDVPAEWYRLPDDALLTLMEQPHARHD